MRLADEFQIHLLQGRTVSFRNAVVIMTSNLGSQDILAASRSAAAGGGAADPAFSLLTKDRVMLQERCHSDHQGDVEVMGYKPQKMSGVQPEHRPKQRLCRPSLFAADQDRVMSQVSRAHSLKLREISRAWF